MAQSNIGRQSKKIGNANRNDTRSNMPDELQMRVGELMAKAIIEAKAAQKLSDLKNNIDKIPEADEYAQKTPQPKFNTYLVTNPNIDVDAIISDALQMQIARTGYFLKAALGKPQEIKNEGKNRPSQWEKNFVKPVRKTLLPVLGLRYQHSFSEATLPDSMTHTSDLESVDRIREIKNACEQLFEDDSRKTPELYNAIKNLRKKAKKINEDFAEFGITDFNDLSDALGDAIALHEYRAAEAVRRINRILDAKEGGKNRSQKTPFLSPAICSHVEAVRVQYLVGDDVDKPLSHSAGNGGKTLLKALEETHSEWRKTLGTAHQTVNTVLKGGSAVAVCGKSNGNGKNR